MYNTHNPRVIISGGLNDRQGKAWHHAVVALSQLLHYTCVHIHTCTMYMYMLYTKYVISMYMYNIVVTLKFISPCTYNSICLY